MMGSVSVMDKRNASAEERSSWLRYWRWQDPASPPEPPPAPPDAPPTARPRGPARRTRRGDAPLVRLIVRNDYKPEGQVLRFATRRGTPRLGPRGHGDVARGPRDVADADYVLNISIRDISCNASDRLHLEGDADARSGGPQSTDQALLSVDLYYASGPAGENGPRGEAHYQREPRDRDLLGAHREPLEGGDDRPRRTAAGASSSARRSKRSS
jgi:hypothetical protein